VTTVASTVPVAPRAPRRAPSRAVAEGGGDSSNTLPSIPATAGDGGVLDEGALMEKIRVTLTSKPHRAEVMIREAALRFPNSGQAEMRDMMLIIALFNQVRHDEARAEAHAYFGRYPGGRYTDDIASLLHIDREPTTDQGR
jgi:hypothetical protein